MRGQLLLGARSAFAAVLLSLFASLNLAAQTTVTVTSATKSQVVLTWTPVLLPGTVNYQVQRRAISDGSYGSGGSIVSTTTYTDTTIDAFTAYSYRVYTIWNGNILPPPSAESYVGPPPTGFSVVSAEPQAEFTTATGSATDYGDYVSMALDANGDPAVVFADAVNASAQNKYLTSIYFVGWDRAHHKWKTPVLVDTPNEFSIGKPSMTLAYDSSTNMFGVLYTNQTGTSGSFVIALSSDGGATWSKQTVVTLAASADVVVGSGLFPLQMANGQVYLLLSENPGAIYYITGAETTAPGTWKMTAVPVSNDSNPAFDCIAWMSLDSSNSPGVAYECSNGNVSFWRPGAAAPTLAMNPGTSFGGFGAADDIKVAFAGTNPRILVHEFRNNLGGTIVNNLYMTDLWVVASNDGGNTWGTPVQLPDDGNTGLNNFVTLAIGPQGQAAVSARSAGGNSDLVTCGYPKLMQSTDLINWTHCNPGNSPAPIVGDDYETALFASNGKLYLAFQNYNPAFFQNNGSADLPAGVILWRQAPQASGLPAPMVGLGGVINNAGETPGAPVAPGSIIEIYGTNLGATAGSTSLPLRDTLGPVQR